MPQYELMYLLGSNVADTDVPALSAGILKTIDELGGTDVVENNLGKKKLAYPIKKTRNGTYVTVNFTMEGKKVNELDAKIRTQDQTIIRYLLINLDEHMDRLEKDKVAQSKMIRRQPPEATDESAPAPAAPAKEKAAAPLAEIDEKALDEKIEAALTEDMTK